MIQTHDLGRFKLLESHEEHDASWDEYLEKLPQGQFEQSALWSSFKKCQDWSSCRYRIFLDESLIGGFQILIKKKTFLRVGYIPKGPVVSDNSPNYLNAATDALRFAFREQRLHALIAQAPDDYPEMQKAMVQTGFIPTGRTGISLATSVIILTYGLQRVIEGMNQTTRKKIRQSQKRGLLIREGDICDIDHFFSLMSNSCRRQGGVKPNPSTSAQITHLWNTFHPHNKIRLTFAEHEGKSIAGLLLLIFGGRVTAWKKGWSGEFAELRPNELLYHEAISWSCDNGYDMFDFSALRYDIAVSIHSGIPLSQEQLKSRDYLHLRFGARARILPDPCLLLKSKMVSAGVRLFELKKKALNPMGTTQIRPTSR